MSEVVPDTALRALQHFGIDGLDEYGRALRAACAASPPPFGKAWYGDRYRYYATDPSWFASSLIGNAAKEGEGSSSLWDLSAQIRDGTSPTWYAGTPSINRGMPDLYFTPEAYLPDIGRGDTGTEFFAPVARLYHSRLPGTGRSLSRRTGAGRTYPDEHRRGQDLDPPDVDGTCHRPAQSSELPTPHASADGRARTRRAPPHRIHRKAYRCCGKKKSRLAYGLMERRVRDFNELTLSEVGIRDVDPGSYE